MSVVDPLSQILLDELAKYLGGSGLSLVEDNLTGLDILAEEGLCVSGFHRHVVASLGYAPYVCGAGILGFFPIGVDEGLRRRKSTTLAAQELQDQLLVYWSRHFLPIFENSSGTVLAVYLPRAAEGVEYLESPVSIKRYDSSAFFTLRPALSATIGALVMAGVYGRGFDLLPVDFDVDK